MPRLEKRTLFGCMQIASLLKSIMAKLASCMILLLVSVAKHVALSLTQSQTIGRFSPDATHFRTHRDSNLTAHVLFNLLN